MRPILVLISLTLSAIVNAQGWADTTNRVETVLSRYKATNPGAQLAISRNGQMLYSTAKGMANLEDSIRLTIDSRIEAGSVSKQFTAACILLLEQQGKLSLTDDIRKYIPEIPDYGYTITIRHLMTHTSGIKDWGSVAGVTGWPRSTKAYNNPDALHIISRQTTLNNVPGAEYIYSNSNYNLQAIIIQRVSGLSLAEFSKQNIFIPAGMTHTAWRDDYQRIVPHRAIAYSKEKDIYSTEMPNENVYGNGGLLTTAEDLVRWNNFYLGGHLGHPSLLSRQLATGPLNNGRHLSYAAGLVVDSVNGEPVISHSGATAGYRANLEYYPRSGLTIAWLSNTSEAGNGQVPVSIRNIFVPNRKGTLITPRAPKSDIAVSQFQSWMGAYRDTLSGEGLRLYMKEDGIYSGSHGGPLEIIDKNTLKTGRARIVFTAPRNLSFIGADGIPTFFLGVDTAQTDPSSLQQYIGKYYSEEAEATIYIVWKNGKLIMYTRPTNEQEIKPIYKDGFSFEDGYIIFLRNAGQAITGFHVSVGRARNILFTR